MRKCPECGWENASNRSHCANCEKYLDLADAIGEDSSGARADSGRDIESRYTDAYRVAIAVIAFGSAVKVIGAIIAAVLALASLAAFEDLGGGVALGGLLIAAVLLAGFWSFGVLVTAQGQLLFATLDTAVNGSPFLDQPQRARIMGIALSKETSP